MSVGARSGLPPYGCRRPQAPGTLVPVEIRERITIDPLVCSREVGGSASLSRWCFGTSRPDDRSSTIVGEYPELEVEVIGARLRLAAWLASSRSLDVPRVA